MWQVENLQLSAFCAKRIEPSAKNITPIMNELNKLGDLEFLPSIYNVPQFDFSKETVQEIPNLSFATIQKISKIICSSDRIDSIFYLTANTQNKIDEYFSFAAKILSMLMDKQEILSNRLALNVHYVNDRDLSNSSYENHVKALCPFYGDKTAKEWSFRINATDHINLSMKSEPLNIITSVDKELYYNNEIPSYRIVCHSDVNTLYENQTFRFSHKDIQPFQQQTRAIFEKVSANLKGMISNAE